ncbi:MAG: hypothetical protein SGBAC_007063 [Bacillariaceae sp.]
MYRLSLPPQLIHCQLDSIVAHAERFAKDHLVNGWHTDLYSLTKQDIALRDIPGMAQKIQPIFDFVTYAIRTLYGCQNVVVDKNQPHILKYSVDSGHTGVELHHDRCDVTANLALSRSGDYCGGGTYIRDTGSIVKLNYGECLLHPGNLVHVQCFAEAKRPLVEDARKLQTIEPDLILALPETDEAPSAINLVGLGAEGSVQVLLNTADTDVLVVLSQRNSDTEYIPVGRSYNGYDWEAAPGLHRRLPITCGDLNAVRKCQLELDNSDEDGTYFLTRYTRAVSDNVRVARFLEMATFGPTLSLINTFEYDNLEYGMANFVKDQIENQPVNSHREFYRRHLNVRAVETYKHGVIGPGACERNSKWRRFAFTTKDMAMSKKDRSFALTVEAKMTPSPAYILSFAGFPRTVLYEHPQYYKSERSQTVIGVLSDGVYPICFVEDVQGEKRIDTPYKKPPSLKVVVGGKCRPVVGGNPTVHLDLSVTDGLDYHELDLSGNTLIPLDLSDSQGATLLLDNDVESPTCAEIADPQDSTHKSFLDDCDNVRYPGDCDHYKRNGWRNPLTPVFGRLSDGSFVLYDTRLELDENTIENPLIDGGGKKVVNSLFAEQTSVYNDSPRPAYYCANAPQDIFNEAHCKLSFDPNVCVSSDSAVINAIPFDEDTLKQVFSLTGRYVYAVKGLIFDSTIHPETAADQDFVVDLPCTQLTRSRWLKLDSTSDDTWVYRDGSTGPCTSPVETETTTEFASAIHSSTDQNPIMKDLYFRGSCAESDMMKHDMLVFVAEENQCYQNVHPDYLSIFDLTNWAPSPDDTVNHHPGGSGVIRKWTDTGIMDYPAERYSWHTMDRWHRVVKEEERFGEFIGRVGDSVSFEDLPPELQTEAVALSLGANQLGNVVGRSYGTLVCGSQGEVAPDPMEEDYFEINMFDSDTLDTMVQPQSQKQTIWTHFALTAEDQLRQKMAWALSQIVVITPTTLTDNRATEPFLVFYDILVRNGLGNYSVKMGEMLTYVSMLTTDPDENYARELMQLFTIGTIRLNMDGTEVLDCSGNPIMTYDSKDIVSFARAWTGFARQPYRGNIEDITAPTRQSYLDPMRIQDIRFRDLFPKRGLSGKFIGDRYPLCSDLPDKAFLRKGAKYRLLGGNPTPKLQRHYGVDWNDPKTKRFNLSPQSSLYNALKCQQKDGECIYIPVVTLSTNLQCYDKECNIDTVRTVQVGGVFYEYIRVACVEVAVYNNAKKLSAGYNDDLSMCGNPKVASATEACCGINRDTDQLVFQNPRRADRSCEYLGEKVTFATNMDRCESLGGHPCDMEGFLHWNENSNQECIHDIKSSNQHIWDNIWHWTNAPCNIQLAIKSNGLIALHHNPDKSGHTAPPRASAHVDALESLNYFSVHWPKNATNDDQFPSMDNNCGDGACQVLDDATCLCDTDIVDSAVFSSIPSRSAVLSQLSIGAFPVDMFDQDDYAFVDSREGVEVWRKTEHEGTLSPTPSPSSSCDRNLIGWNADAETGTNKTWSRWGNYEIEMQQPGFHSSFAFRYYPQEVIWNTYRSIAHELPTQCLEANDGILISFKVKLENATDGSAVSCDPQTTSGHESCPFLRLLIQNKGKNHLVPLYGLREWNEREWNTFELEYIIPIEYDSITRIVPCISIGGPSASDGRVLLVDDVSIIKDAGIVASKAPSSSPTSLCPYFNMGVNGDAETGDSTPYASIGSNASLTVQSEDVYAGSYAFKFKAYAWYGGMKKLVRNMQRPKAGEREAQCISSGTKLLFRFKAKLINETRSGAQGVHCDPTSRAKGGNLGNSSGCPFIRHHVKVDGMRSKKYDLWGFDDWDADGWNSFSATWTVPEYENPIKRFQITFLPNRYSSWPSDTMYMLLDEFQYYVVPSTDPPSLTPTSSAWPSVSPTLLPTLKPTKGPTEVPTSSPTTFESYSKDTVFRVMDEKGDYIHLKNMKSVVEIGSGASQSIKYSIRNPPSFYDLSEIALRDAYYETDAVIDHLAYHDNTPPFISKNIIQHFGISNPSPRYVETVATAFRTGSYVFEQTGYPDMSFGENKWGDLSAVAAAILLDREAMAVVVESDPVHGSVKEPMAKVISLMRSMEYTRAEHAKLKYPILSSGLRQTIGQMPYEAPDVFSFFGPDYQPPGALSQASLVSPESQVLSMISILGMSNGLSALIKNGMTSCSYGFGRGVRSYSCDYPDGRLAYMPSAAANTAEKTIDELSLLLTSGRLGDENKIIVLDQYNRVLASDTADKALQVAQQLIVNSPEFQTSSIVRKSGSPRASHGSVGSTSEPYKVVINVNLFGGMDSFYMLSPHSSCSLYSEYSHVRGKDATLKPMDMEPLDASSSANQPCEKFAVHKKLGVMKELYDSGMGLFMANTGHLEKPVTKQNYRAETRAQLFAHNSMQNEAAFVDAMRENVGTGVLGRMLDVLQQKGYAVSAISIDGNGPVLDGNSRFGRAVDVVKRNGVDRFYDSVGSPSDAVTLDDMKSAFNSLNGDVEPNSGKYADHWSQTFIDSVNKADVLKESIENVSLTNDRKFTGRIGPQLKAITKLIKAREERGVDRDAFHVRFGGWDHHRELKRRIEPRFSDLHKALDAFKREMTEMGLIDQVTLVVTSEFSRTLSQNSGAGTDHAWGGNYFVMGGQVNGGKILGEYPQGFTASDPTNDGRGRLWFGISEEDDLDYVLPNRGNFGCDLLAERDLYKLGTQTNKGCEGDVININQRLPLEQTRYLTGEEQRTLCDRIGKVAVEAAGEYSFHCVVVGQLIEEVDSMKTYQLKLDIELSTDAVGVADVITQRVDARFEDMSRDLMSIDKYPFLFRMAIDLANIGTYNDWGADFVTISCCKFESDYSSDKQDPLGDPIKVAITINDSQLQRCQWKA